MSAPDEWPPTDETSMTLTLPVKDVRALAAHLRHVRPIDVEFDPGWLADELRSQVRDHVAATAERDKRVPIDSSPEGIAELRSDLLAAERAVGDYEQRRD